LQKFTLAAFTDHHIPAVAGRKTNFQNTILQLYSGKREGNVSASNKSLRLVHSDFLV
jgi:hypothetical protein